jgi:hypothetical protein
MNPEDVALCQQAIALANSGETQAAYEQFCAIHNRGNTEDVTLLYWIAFTTPSPVEAQRAIDTIARLEPDHPKLQALQPYVDRKEERQYRQQQEEQQKQTATPQQPHVYAWVPPQDKPKRKRGKRVGLVLLGLVIVLGLVVVLFGRFAQSSTPYPWTVTYDSGYSRETTFLGAPIGGAKLVQLHLTLTNVSNEALSPDDLEWTLTDTSTNVSYPGTLDGSTPAVVLSGDNCYVALDFQVPITSNIFMLSLSGPAGPDPTTWTIRF